MTKQAAGTVRLLKMRRIRALAVAVLAFYAACSRDSTSPTPPRETATATIGPSGGTVVTPSGAAGASIPPGTFGSNVEVTITQLPAPESPGSGPLPTGLRQYPPYYEFKTSPAVPQFGDSVRVGVCQVNNPSDPFYAPEQDHPRLRLARGTGSGIEILAPVNVSDFLVCNSVTASTGTRTGSGVRSMLARLISPRPVYAAHGGLGGKVRSFSPFGAVVDECNVPANLPIGGTINGKFDASDCILEGIPTDIYSFTTTSQSTIRFSSTGGGSDAIIVLQSLPGPPGDLKWAFGADMGRADYAIIPAGTWGLYVRAGSSGARNTYSVTTQLVTGPLAGCTSGGSPQGPETHIRGNVTISGTITTTDCTGSAPTIYVDHHSAYVVAGQRYPISLTANNLRLEVCRPSGGGGCTLLQGQTVLSGTGGFTFVPSVTEVVVVNVVSAAPGGTGAYTLTYTRE